jgi:hypothetical protein
MENELLNVIPKYLPLSQEEKKVIMDSAVFRTCKKGTVLRKEGDLSQESYYVVDGEEKTTTF